MCAKKDYVMTTTEKLVEATNRLANIMEATLKETVRQNDGIFMRDESPPKTVFFGGHGEMEGVPLKYEEDDSSLSSTVDGLVVEITMIEESISLIGDKLGASFVSPAGNPTVPDNVVELLERARERLGAIREFLSRVSDRIG